MGMPYPRLILERCQGNKREAARVLGISYHTLTTYLKVSESDVGIPGESSPDVAGEGTAEEELQPINS